MDLRQRCEKFLNEELTGPGYPEAYEVDKLYDFVQTIMNGTLEAAAQLCEVSNNGGGFAHSIRRMKNDPFILAQQAAAEEKE